jgi:DICT domain-containing protein
MGKYVREPSHVSAAISHELRDQIEIEADRQDVTISAVVRNIIEQYFGLHKK